MRTFQLIFIVLFLIFYTAITLGAIKTLTGVVNPPKRKIVQKLVLVISSTILVGFVILYIWPLTTRNTNEYSAHLIFNIILSIDFIFKIPSSLAYVTGIFFSKKHKPIIYYIGILLSIALSSSVFYGAIIGTKELVTNHIELRFQNLPKSFDGYQIMQISDIHLGNFLKSKKLMKKVQNETDQINPDMILFTGDMVNNFSNESEGYDNIFKGITKNRQGFSILGNHDYGDYTNWESEISKTENFNQIISAHDSFGLQLLNNEHVEIKSGSDSIFVIGVENWGHPPFPQYANMDEAMNGIPEESFKILLSHDPAHWEEIVKYRDDIALTLSGHTHGLQWGIKKAGITFSLSYFTRSNWGGLYKFENSKLYVSTGLGTVGIPWRINMPPEMTLITLKRMEIN